MKTTLTSVTISVSLDDAIAILKCPNPLAAYKSHLTTAHGVHHESVLNYDLENLKKTTAIELGGREIERLTKADAVKEEQS